MNQAGGGGGGTNIQLDADTAATILAAHEDAASGITALADSVPQVDGGLGNPELLTILTLLLHTAGSLASVNSLTADMVRAVVDHIVTVDAEVASVFLSADLDRFDGPYPLIPPEAISPPAYDYLIP